MTQERVIDIITWSLYGLLLVAFALVCWRDVAMLFEKPLKAFGYLLGLLLGVGSAILITAGLFYLTENNNGEVTGYTWGRISLAFFLPVIYVLIGFGMRYVVHPSPGFQRMLAIARHAIMEAWAARVWALVIVWIVVAGVLIVLARPFDESERTGEYVNILLRSQEFLVLVFVTVMAVISLPRERDRKTLVTTGSKPVSRLEFFLGKFLGFMGVGLGMLIVMGLLSWLFLVSADFAIRGNADAEIKRMESDIHMRAKGKVGVGEAPRDAAMSELDQANSPIASIQSLTRIKEEGTLSAYNYISTPAGGMQVLGKLVFAGDETRQGEEALASDAKRAPDRYIRGGSNERALYRFPQRNEKGEPLYVINSKTTQVRIGLKFKVVSALDPKVFAPGVPDFIKCRVVVRGYPAGKEQQQAEVVLFRRGNLWGGSFPLESPERFLAYYDLERNFVEPPPISVEVSCIDENVFLQVIDPTEPRYAGNVNASNVVIANVWEKNIAQGSMEPPKIYGWEKRDKQQFRGPPQREVTYEVQDSGIKRLYRNTDIPWDGSNDEVASWIFENIKQSDVPLYDVVTPGGKTEKMFRIAMELEVEKQDNYSETSRVKVIVHRRQSKRGDGQTYWDGETNIIEKRPTYINVPASVLPIGTGEDIYVELQCLVPGHWLSAVDNSVRIDQADSPFVVNLFKSELIIFVELSLLAMAAVTFSIRLGWPVALLSTFTVYILGSVLTFIKDLQGQSILEMIGLRHQTDPSTGFSVMDWILQLAFKFVNVLANLMPDFTRYDPTTYIIQSRNIPWSVMLDHVTMLGLWMIPFVALGYLMIRKQEYN